MVDPAVAVTKGSTLHFTDRLCVQNGGTMKAIIEESIAVCVTTASSLGHE